MRSHKEILDEARKLKETVHRDLSVMLSEITGESRAKILEAAAKHYERLLIEGRVVKIISPFGNLTAITYPLLEEVRPVPMEDVGPFTDPGRMGVAPQDAGKDCIFLQCPSCKIKALFDKSKWSEQRQHICQNCGAVYAPKFARPYGWREGS